MVIACVLYDEYTMLDIVGPFQVLSGALGMETVWVAEKEGPVADHTRTTSLIANATFDDVTSPTIVVVPGGMHTSAHFGGPVVEWLRAVHPTTTWTTSVCTGSLLLGSAGLLDGLTATSHWVALETLRDFGAEPTLERVVLHPEERIATSAGVSSGIDMGLTLIAEMRGTEAAEITQLALEYDPQPPTDAGSPEKAPAAAVELVRSFLAGDL